MEHPHVFETPVSNGDAPLDVAGELAADRLKLVRRLSQADNFRDVQIANAPGESAMPEVWVARMLRAIGAVLMFATALSVLRDLTLARGAPLHGLTAEVLAFGIGLAVFACSSWLAPRPWRWFLLAAYSLLV